MRNPHNRAAGTTALMGLIGLWLIPSAMMLIVLAIVAIAWNIPVPSIGVVVLTCLALGPAWFFTTSSTMKIMSAAVEDRLAKHERFLKLR